jgi:DNA-binding transcriptional regulator PaaX
VAAALTSDISGGIVVLRLFYATFKVYFLTFSGSSTTIESASLILIFELLACSDRRLSSSLQKLSAFGNEKKKKEKRTLFYDY